MSVKLTAPVDVVNEPKLGDLEVFPEGVHLVRIVDSELVNPLDKDWSAIQLKMRGVQGVAEGQEVTDLIFLEHTSKPKAVAMGRKKLSSYGDATQLKTIEDTISLHDKLIKVDVKHATRNDYLNADVKAIYPADTVIPAKVSSPTTTSNPFAT